MSVATDPQAALPTMSLPDLESELLGLAGHIAAAECRFLQLLAEFDLRGGWAGVGVRSCAHWLTWRAGMSLRTATEHLRVAHALTDLPRVTAAFAAGRISYSKVRAITRVAPGTAVPASILASGVGPARPAEATASDFTAATTTADTTDPAGPADTTDTTEAAYTTGTRAPADGTRAPAGPGAPPAAPGVASVAEPGVVDPGTAEQVLVDLALSGTASHVETIVRQVRRRTTPPADLTARRGVTWHHDADGSLVLRGRFTPEDGAALIAAIESRVPAPTPAGPANVALPPDLDRQALEHSPGRVVDRLAARRADALLELVQGSDEATAPVVARGSADVVVHLEIADGAARVADGTEISTATAERLACDGRARVLLDDRSTNRLYLGRSRRLASPAQIAALTARDSADGGGCRFPGCGRRRWLHAHHVRHWLHGGRTDVDNLVLICGYHHRLVHEHGYRIRLRDGGGWEFRRPDGRPVEPSGAPLTGRAEGVAEINVRAGLEIDRTTLTPDWYGDRLDPGPILDALLPPRPTGTTTAA